MRVTNDMIDPELRRLAFFGKLLMRPSAWFFRMMAKSDQRSAGKDIDGLDCGTVTIPGPEAGVQLRVRTYRPVSPATDGPLPGVLFLHGGGYVMGNPEGFGSVYEMLIKKRDCVIVAPDYRKAFTAPYPAAAEDCYATLLWLKENAATLGIRDDQLIVMGQSAGGGLAAAVTLMARDRGEVNVASQFPLYPMIDDRTNTPSAADNDAPIWNAKHNRTAWKLYLGDLAGGDVPKYAAPARETDYSRLPPTTTFVGGLDPFRDETIAYVENLKAAGIPVEFHLAEGCFHGFDLVQTDAAVSREANEFFLDQFAAAVDGHFAKQP